ncbi:S8 family peptidase [Flavobacterium sp. SM15]|uniref:S8/S53 family peptidase n=1 Tax=Flavobacterium sp. SM15 TaxID=2908005 RepID=UPI001EDB9487|nr:S8/S53 family peptidase [Flavobacterium sp. SM15]MCG2611190.1 S8 family peptidase [Flavobacterium sp. SM15]
MKSIRYLFLVLGFQLFAQSGKGELRLAPNSDVHELYVCFSDEFRFESGDYKEELVKKLPQFETLSNRYALDFEKGIAIPDDQLKFLSKEAVRLSGSDVSVRKLKNILRVKVDAPTNEKLLEIAKLLEAYPEVVYCSLMSLQPIAPPSDIPPTTDDYLPNQSYLAPDPGVNMESAWALGLKGSGIRVRDVEYGFNSQHEDLNQVNVFIAPGMTINSSASASYTEHGTPVFGIVMADDGGYGISGMANQAREMVLFPEWQQTGYNRINAIVKAISNSRAGDVILFEMQAYGQGGSLVPAEFDAVVWDLTKAATDAGIIIVEAGANGGQNLDSAYYASYMNRGNSGAILVGGGRSNLTHDRISYSNYGLRFDVQGWAENVFACGYGNVVQVGGDFNQGYTNFNGTSAATPMVASCVIVLQSYYFSLTGVYMTPVEMRRLLNTTGIPQGTSVVGNIGPLPNMKAAIDEINTHLSLQQPELLITTLYPNPAHQEFTITLSEAFSENTFLELYDALGRKVIGKQLYEKQSTVALGNLPDGMYFVKVVCGNKSATKKLLIH